MRVPENLKIFTILSVVYSFFFFFVIYQHMAHACWWQIALVCGYYAFLMFYSAGKLAGEVDSSAMKQNKSFAFHLSAYITVNIVHALFFVFDWVSAGATLTSVISTAVIWGVALAYHGYMVGRKMKKEATAHDAV